MDTLEDIKDEGSGLIDESVDVRVEFGLGRSFRRGSDSQAIAQGVDERDVDLNNRWHTFKNARGRHPCLKMQQHYAEARLILPALLRYSAAL